MRRQQLDCMSIHMAKFTRGAALSDSGPLLEEDEARRRPAGSSHPRDRFKRQVALCDERHFGARQTSCLLQSTALKRAMLRPS